MRITGNETDIPAEAQVARSSTRKYGTHNLLGGWSMRSTIVEAPRNVDESAWAAFVAAAPDDDDERYSLANVPRKGQPSWIKAITLDVATEGDR